MPPAPPLPYSHPPLPPRPPAAPAPPLPINPALPPLPPATPAVVWVKPLPPLPNGRPPFWPSGFSAVPLAPSPISGRPNSVWVGALIALSTICSTVWLSAAAYRLPPEVRACTNWS
ncbi:Uncharacterised protein [Mycobacterium tuberculosis]|nr:Uncharacterised protein [Mycobacterium tuberculosis]